MASNVNTTNAGARAFYEGDIAEKIVAAAKLGLDKAKLDEANPRLDEVPFTSETRRMTTLNRTADATGEGVRRVGRQFGHGWKRVKGVLK